jgi:DNA-binding NtrC family response regulator
VRHFLDQVIKRNNLDTIKVSDSAISLMMAYSWPGNVRELQNAVQFSVVRCKNRIIMPDDLPLELHQFKSAVAQRGPSKKLDAESVRQALTQAGGNKAKAARRLGVGRATLYRFFNDNPDWVKEPGTVPDRHNSRYDQT